MLGSGTASQKSSLGPNVISVYGEAVTSVTAVSGASSLAGGTAKSYFQYEFEVLNTHSYSFSGTLDTQGIVTSGATLPTLDNSIVLENLTTSTVLFDALTNDESFLTSGFLTPGTYRLTAVATVDSEVLALRTGTRTAAGNSTFDFVLRAQNLPESGTGSSVFFLGALGGLTVLARRRRSASHA